ncbi:TonB-dependent receptor [Pseudoxanthomonas suwonensis 11-1]|uniref:TonB-dependent receptor n=1 Tax=Pseudoxanthomonas suwonensis (strain 11-1) TaxID=743721 RepID=E6WVV1_PSEUU|nr:TonB-dependent receptor [Pseudoxanthomonas suwonensis]ADV28374.1 TonB-dependent receptor [Pseudoxanthomonas suwonensis 11-1]
MNKLPRASALALSITALLFLPPAHAETKIEPDASGSGVATTLDRLTVTGARATGRTIENSPAPIDVISAQELESTTRTDLFEALNNTLPAWNTPVRANASDLGSMIRVGQLRGLSPNHTLVLVNGKRWHTTALFGAGGLTGQAPVDLATFPTGAIQRLEVLRDGASAIYGSDAIAGVVNIITSQQAEGGEVAYRYGVNDGGEGELHTLTARAGFGLGQEGYINFAIQYDDQDPTITSTDVPLDYPLFFLRDADGNPVVPTGSVWRPQIPEGATLDPREHEVDRGRWRWPINGRRKSELRGFTANAGTPLGESTELFAFFNHARRQAWAPQFFRPVWRDDVVRVIHPDGFQPKEEIREQSVGGTIGLRGSLAGDWQWETSVTHGQDAIRAYIHDSINPTFGLDSQTSFYLGKVRYAATTWNLDLRRGFEVGLASPLELSLGAEARQEDYRKWAGDPQSYTHGGGLILDGPNAGKPYSRAVGYSQALAGFSPDDAVEVGRDNWAVYAGLSLNPVERWTVDLAARHEDYEDFGTASTWRLSSRVELGRRWALRGTASTGFQAPALAAQAHKFTQNSPAGVTYTLQVGSPQAQALGARPLRPEESENYSIGLVFQPWDGASAALDVYRIDVDNRIATSTSISGDSYPGALPLLQSLGYGRADAVSYLLNAANTRNEGVEATFEASSDLGRFGSVRWTAAGNWTRGELRSVAPTPAVLADYDVPVFSRGNSNLLLLLSPKSKQILSADWELGRWSTLLRFTRYGSLERYGVPVGRPASEEVAYTLDPVWITDLDIGFQLNDHLRLAVTASNLFNQLPDRLPAVLTQPGQYYSYPVNGPVSADGGFYSASIEYRW